MWKVSLVLEISDRELKKQITEPIDADDWKTIAVLKYEKRDLGDLARQPVVTQEIDC